MLWHDIAANIAATRLLNGESGRPGASTGKLSVGSSFAALKAADTEWGRRKGRKQKTDAVGDARVITRKFFSCSCDRPG
jgi:hypothetical protein